MNDISDRELLELIATQVGKLTNEFSEFKKETSENFQNTNSLSDTIDKHVILIENEHGSKLNALLDGYKQLSESQEEIKTQIKDLSSDHAKQDLEIRVLKSKAK